MSATKTWQAEYGAEVPKELDSSFKITALPKTDIWRRGDDDDVFNAPMIYQTVKGSHFKKIEVTVFAPWRTKYDQGGLVINFPSKNGPSKWIKAGIEFFESKAVLGVVGTDRYSDWSLAPLDAGYHQKARFVATREDKTLWIHAAQEGKELVPLREVKWAFLEGRDEDAEVQIGVYAAKPTQDVSQAREATKFSSEALTDTG